MEEDFILDKKGLTQIMDLIEQQFGSHSEVCLHDLSNPYDHTIVDIRHGYITGRSVGNCGSNLGLEVIRGTVKNGDRFSYFTNTRDGKILRSSTVYLRDCDGKVRYAICVNTDITETVKFESFLRESNGYELGTDNASEEFFARNVSDLLEYFLAEGQKHVGKEPKDMNKEDKMKILEFLDKKGAFLIAKSGEKVCEAIGISKFTLYNYLETIRKSNSLNNSNGE